ncbi:hypothetical protein KKF61_07330, partial [Patescibacteria group bacterium]|nr:hypothetical protein [Patescibacteria group bacterium]
EMPIETRYGTIPYKEFLSLEKIRIEKSEGYYCEFLEGKIDEISLGVLLPVPDCICNICMRGKGRK